MTAIKLLEKLGADASFDQSLLSEEDKNSVEEIIHRAKNFIAMEIIHAPDEEEEESEQDSEDEPESESEIVK